MTTYRYGASRREHQRATTSTHPRGRTRRVLLVGLTTALFASMLSPAEAQLGGVRTLTLTGPARAGLGIGTIYSGRLTLANVGVPLMDVELREGTSTLATAQTAQDGTYSAVVTFTTSGIHQFRAIANRGTPLETQSDPITVEVPKDPPPVPANNLTVAGDIFAASEFIYTGPNALQTGVAPGTIKPHRVAVLRGAINDVAGDPLPRVTVTIPDHAEFGQSEVSSSGAFDMVVNGGQELTIRFEKDGFLPVERTIEAPWRDYAVVDDVVMTPLDSSVTNIESGSPDVQVARASTVSDADGTRRATLLFPPATQATMVLPGGGEQPLTSMEVRATEYTVGNQGPQAMPGDLPPASGYTYAVELSVDEAIEAGAEQVVFNQPVPFYVENFIGIPTGEAAPVGYYDRASHAWLPSQDGRVVEIISETSAKADMDIDGDGAADPSSELAVLGITDDEREQLATLYNPGQSLWRIAVEHFSAPDINWPFGLPAGATSPGQEEGESGDEDSQCTQAGSIIGCEGQTLGETIPIAGTPYHLRYDTSRAIGRSASRSLRIPLSGATLPTGLKRITVDVTVAGRAFSESFAPPTTNLVHLFTWDAKDPYGRLIQGREQATVRIGYAYDGVYWSAGGTLDGVSFGATGLNALADQTRREITLYQRYTSMLGGVLDSGARGLGGWSMSAHHVYDPDGRTLYRGDGTTTRADAFLPSFRVFAGTGNAGQGSGTYSGDGGAARLAGLSRVKGLDVGPDGSVYIADWGNGVVRRVSPQGVISTFAGGGFPASGNGDGGPATSAELQAPTDVAVGSDGSVYISDMGSGSIRRVAADGTITTFAGGGSPPDSIGDGLPAVQAALPSPRGMAVGADGSLYVADVDQDRVRVIGADGVITTFAGGGSPSDGLGDGERAPQAALANPLDVAIGADGSVFIADSNHDRVRRVDPSGEISTYAGNGAPGYTGDGGAAGAAALMHPAGLALDQGGRLLIAQRLHHVIRAVDTEGNITTLAGTGTAGYAGDQGPPAAARLREPQALAVGPDHKVYVADTENFRVRLIDAAMPGFSTDDIIVPSSDGAELFHFDKGGRHLRTLDALTGVALATFAYDPNGRLVSVTDVHGNATTIERNASGIPTAIVSPYGLRTQLTINANGRLTSLQNPANETVSMSYVSDGLLETFTTPSGTSTFTYDGAGRLTVDNGPGPGATTLNRTEIPRGYRVTVTSPAGRATTYETENLASGSLRRTITQPWGGLTRSVAKADGTIELTAEDGTKVTSALGPDPRFGMMTPLPTSMTTTTPAARQVNMSFARSVTLSDPTDPLTLTAQTDTVTSNSKTVTRAYNRGTNTLTTTSAEGRQGTVAFNNRGSVVDVSAGGLAPVTFTYDTSGRIATVTRGSGATARTTTMTYDPQGFLDTVTNPASETTSFDYDGVGRVTKQVLADSNQIAFAYDGVGNLSSLTPPGRSAHGLVHDTRDLLDRYRPPALSTGATDTTYAYTNDKQVDSMTLPTTEVVDHQYDTAGRLDALSFSRGLIDYTYTGSTAKLSSITAPGGIGLSYSFDGPLVTALTATGDAQGTVGYGYDADLRVGTRTINGVNSTGYTYDKDGLVKTAGGLTLNWGAASGLLSASTLGAVSTSHGYNSFGEPETMAATYTDPVTQVVSPRYSVSYTRDALGRIATKSETIGGTTTVWGYTYDARGRLTRVTKDGVAHASYDYDANGNRESVTEGGNTTAATFDAQDRLTAQGSTTYQYTKDGQLSSKTASSVTTSYDYDELGNLMEVASPTRTVAYKVDGLGRRVVKKVDGTITNRLLYGQGLQPIAELDASGSGIKSQFIYASRGHVPDFMIRSGVTYRFVTDQIGSVRMVVDTSTGAVVQRIDYDVWGRVLSDTNPGFQPFGFAGGLYDPDTGLVRFGARDYDAEAGRWTAKDPISFVAGEANLYSYVHLDPVNFLDPSGLLELNPVTWASELVHGVGDLAGGVMDALGNFSATVGCLIQSIPEAMAWYYSPLLEIDYGTALAGITNIVFGAASVAGGVIAVGTGAIVSVFFPLIGTSIVGGGAAAVYFGQKKFRRGVGQLKLRECNGECSVWDNLERVVRGVIPRFVGGT